MPRTEACKSGASTISQGFPSGFGMGYRCGCLDLECEANIIYVPGSLSASQAILSATACNVHRSKPARENGVFNTRKLTRVHPKHNWAYQKKFARKKDRR